MNFEDFKAEWSKAMTGNPRYVCIKLKDGNTILATKYEYRGGDYFRLLRDGFDNDNRTAHPIEIAMVRVGTINYIYNPWSD